MEWAAGLLVRTDTAALAPSQAIRRDKALQAASSFQPGYGRYCEVERSTADEEVQIRDTEMKMSKQNERMESGFPDEIPQTEVFDFEEFSGHGRRTSSRKSSRKEHRANSMDIARAVFKARCSGVSNPLDYSISMSDSREDSISVPQRVTEESILSQHCRRISTVASSKDGSGHAEAGRVAVQAMGDMQDLWFKWACGGRDFRDNEQWNSFEAAMYSRQRLRAEVVMGVLGASITIAAMMVLIVVYSTLGAERASAGPAVFAVIAAVSIVLLRCFNVSRVSTVRQNYRIFCWVLACALVVAPAVPHVLLGGVMRGEEAHSLLLTLLGPLLVLLCMPTLSSQDDLEVGQGALHRRLFATAVWSSPLFQPSPLRTALLARSVLVVLLVACSPWMPPPPAQASDVLRWLPPILTTLFWSLLVTAACRWLMLQCLDIKRELETTLEQEQLEKCKIEHLVHTLVPEFRAEALRNQPPGIWYRNPPDMFTDCSILQMDISGFTQMSTTINAEELIDVINAIFTSIDRLAAAVGEVWKVETIGDCYVAVLGGPLAKERHGERAVVLGLHIVEIVRRISKKIQIELAVRIGIHSGAIAAAVVGCELPRYLTFGRDCEIVNALEAGAEQGCVYVTGAVQLPPEWSLTPCPSLKLRDGSEVSRFMLGEARQCTALMEAARRHRPGLDRFFRSFCASVSKGALLPSPSAPDALPQLSTWPLRFVSETEPPSRLQTSQGAAGSELSADGEQREGEGKPDQEELRKSISELVRGVSEDKSWRSQHQGGLGKLLLAQSLDAARRSGAIEQRSPLGRRLIGARVKAPRGPSAPLAKGRELASWHGPPRSRSRDWTHPRASVERFWTAHGSLGAAPSPQSAGKAPLIADRGPQRSQPMEVGSDLALEIDDPELVGGCEGDEECAAAAEEEEEEEERRSEGAGESQASTSTGRWALLGEEAQVVGRRSVVVLFLLSSCLYGLLLGTLLAFSPAADFEGLPPPFGNQWTMALLPLAYTVCSAALALSLTGRAGGERRVRQLQLAALLLLLSPLLLFGSPRGPLAPLAPLWGFLGVVLQCSFSGGEDLAWLRMAGVHAVLAAVINVVRGMVVDAGTESWEVPVWMVVLYGVAQVVPSTLAVLPLAVTVQEVRDDQVRGKLHLYQHKLNKMREEALLNALLPPSISSRLRQEQDQRIASRYDKVTVLFLYVDGCQDLFLERQEPAVVIAWLNSVFGLLDRILTRHYHRKVCKVETLHNVYLAVSGCPDMCDNHARECLAVALEMIAAASSVLRPDGRPTTVRVGLNSGSICAGVIGTENPRFSIYGDTVNTASRMASSARSATKGNPYVHLSQSSALAISQSSSRWLSSRNLQLAARGEQLAIKGKGIMQTYCVAATKPYAQIEEIEEPPPYTPHTTG